MRGGVCMHGTKDAHLVFGRRLRKRSMSLMERILIVDDEEELAFSLEMALNMAGYQTSVCYDGAHALERIVDSWSMGLPFSLILTDIQIPGLNGKELIKELRKRGMHTPVVAVTGYGDRDMIIELMRVGCDDFVEKPVDVPELLRNVQRIIERRHTRLELEKVASEAIRAVDIYKKDQRFYRSQIESAVNSYSQIVKFNPEGLKVKLAYRYCAVAGLGGDYFDARNYSDGVDIFVADIAGHDMGASYHTVYIKTMFDRYIGSLGGGVELMTALNDNLSQSEDFGRMATALHVRLDLDNMKGEVVSAGHSGMIMFSRENGGARSYSSGSPVLGAARGSCYEKMVFPIRPGDRLFIHTDGLLNAYRIDGRSGARKRLAEAGLINFLASHSALQLDEMVSQTWSDISSFCKRRFTDDALLLAIEIPGEEKNVHN